MDNEAISAALKELATDLRWSWNHAADKLWERLDPELWAFTRNAWIVLQTASAEQRQAAFSDPAFQRLVEDVIFARHAGEKSPRWFQTTFADAPLSAVAYFSMEFMLSEALPIYSGGLGNVAGDQLKAASDLGVPVAGVGLFYQEGYFRQQIDAEGRQQALYPKNDPSQLPITPVRKPNGEWLRVALEIPGSTLWIRAWQAEVGRVRLYLLDSNDPANLPERRGITSELYGGGPDLRLWQEIVLGIGGWRMLLALGIKPEACHLNEGHAAFAVLERARSYAAETGQPFAVALAATRAGNLFTTHTPVAAGFDRFAPELMERALKQYAENELKISMDELLALGRANPGDRSEPFNMAYLAMRGSGAVNGVSRLHGEVSRQIFQGLFPRWPEHEVPVGHVTNGVHMPSWDSAEADELWTRACGKGCWRRDPEELKGEISRMPSEDLWKMRTEARKSLVTFVREHLARQLAGHGASSGQIAVAESIFDPDTLTIGFARRFATYKRPNLLLHDAERLLRILTGSHRPVQLILAGKAHPQDMGGQEMIRQWIAFIRETAARAHAVFLSDYDLQMAEHLVEGVDVWLNTPRRPFEASGTSGMKVLVNGGLNLSELDGWWAEAFTPEVGWAIGDGLEHGDDPHGDDPGMDAADAARVYSLLEQEIVPEFYARDAAGVPQGWVRKIRESMTQLTPVFSAHRAVREYTRSYYLPAASAFGARSANHSEAGIGLHDWERRTAAHWAKLRFGSLEVHADAAQLRFEVQVYLDELDRDSVRAELYAEGVAGGEPVRQVMNRESALVGSENAYRYSATVAADRPAGDFTPRIVPHHPGAAVPLEASQILWYR